MSLVLFIINSAALIWGGVVDFQRREIPNLVPITLIATGFLTGSFLLIRLLSVIFMIGILWLSCLAAKNSIPGGDLKLICALAFSTGLPILLGVLFLVGIEATIVGGLSKQNLSRNIPLCTYVAPSYILLVICLLT